jgi:signal transduction histidine kinase
MSAARPVLNARHARRGGWRRRLEHSLGRRLVLVFLLLALALAGAFVAGMQRALDAGFDAVVRPLLADYVDRLAAEIGTPPDVARARALVARLPLSVRIDGPQVQWDSHPQRRGWRGRDNGGGDGGDGSLFVRRSADGHVVRFGLGDARWATRPRAIGWLTLGALLLFTALAYGYVQRLFRPLDDIRAGAQRFGRGEFDAPIPRRRDDELGDLAAQVNAMAQALQGMLEAKQSLLLAVSHELRSPLTRARLNAELVAEGPARDALLHDLAEMRDLIADLLEGERLAGGHAALQPEPTDLNGLVRALVDERFAGRGLQLVLDPALPAALPLDSGRIRLLVRNLLDNALRATGEAAAGTGGEAASGTGGEAAPDAGGGAVPPPQLRTARDGGSVRIEVRDHGPGVDPALLPRLGEAFFRPDAARQRRTGGVGLGLYLCRRVVQAHRGTLQLRNADPGFEAVVTLPIG